MIGPYELADGTLRALHMGIGLVALAVGVGLRVRLWWVTRAVRDE